MLKRLAASLLKATGLGPELISKFLVRSQDLNHGDFAFPCFALASAWKLSPPECAIKLKSVVELPPGFARAETAGPYLNFFVERKEFAGRVIREILSAGLKTGRADNSAKTIIVEYSSPNIAKPFHIGHLRNLLIGHCLELVYRHLGCKVITIDHLGDWGTQFGFVWAGCELWGKPENADIEKLVGMYVRAAGLSKDQQEGKVSPADRDKPDVTEMARGYFKRLEAGDSDALAFWQWCRDISLDYFNQIYERLGFKFDHQIGEAFFRDKIAKVEADVRASGILEDSRGALGVDLGKKLGFVRVFTEDGRSLYITRDIAAATYRYDTFAPSNIFYVVAAQQSLHFQQLIEILRRMKHPVAELITHVAYGIVPGMKTRAGTVIGLREFLDEAHERALVAYREEVAKRPEGLDEEKIAEDVGIGATAFYFLSHSSVKDFNFKWEEALNFQGDSGPYVQYALARLSSILQKASEAGLKVDSDFDAALLGQDEVHALISLLDSFGTVLERTAREHEPAHLAAFALDIARTVASMYRSTRVLGEEAGLARARLALFAATRYVLHVSVSLIGMPAVEKM